MSTVDINTIGTWFSTGQALISIFPAYGLADRVKILCQFGALICGLSDISSSSSFAQPLHAKVAVWGRGE